MENTRGFRFNVTEENQEQNTTTAKELTTFQKVVLTSAGVGVIAGAALITMKAADHAVTEVAAGVAAAKTVKANHDLKKAEKADKKKKIADKLKAEGLTDEQIAAVIAAM